MASGFEEDLDSIQSFVQEHYSPSMCWGDFKPWMRWYRENKLLGYIKGNDGVEAMAMVRFVDSVQRALEDPYYSDPNCDICWIELVIAPKAENLARLIDLLLTVWGDRPKFAARRNHLGGVIKEYPFSVLSRLSYKGLTRLLPASKQI